MRNVILDVVLVLMMASMFVSCNQNHQKELETAYTLAESDPDSALVYLNHIDQDELSEEEMAKYSLVYYMAQDKSGLDVDNDSLIRIAYDWYDAHQEDSLYALCLNYMGTYYLLVDSLEKTKACLEKSVLIADSLHDMKVISLSLDKLIDIEERLSPFRALEYAKNLVKMYDEMPNATLLNKVVAHLRLCENYWYVDSVNHALDEGKIALSLAKCLGDNELLASVKQDLSNVFDELGQKDSCLFYARQAYDLQPDKKCSCQLLLASAYIGKDSIHQAFVTLEQAIPKTAEDRYSVFYMKSQAAMKMQDYVKVKTYTDSAYHCLEEMYQTALQAKTSYYTSFLSKESERAKVQSRVELQRWVFGLVVLLCCIVSIFILYIYVSYKGQTRLRMKHKLEINRQQQQMQNELHKEELSHKEIQLSIMRSYLQKKIEVVEKLNSITPDTNKHVTLSNSDWRELEVFLDGVENLFVTRLKQKHPYLSKNDLQLMMLLRLKLSQKTLASIYCTSEKAIKQKLFLYKDKVGIKNEHFSLRNYIENF